MATATATATATTIAITITIIITTRIANENFFAAHSFAIILR